MMNQAPMVTASFLVTLMSLIFSTTSFADKRLFYSSPQGARIVELYTSQGCYSCPPAEMWLNKFVDHKQLWKEIIPIGFHVDYWDHLGWKDPFASAEFSQRQRLYKRYGHSKNVATPGFVVDGKGWNGWFQGQPLPTSLTKTHDSKLSASLQGSRLEVLFETNGLNLKAPFIHVALLGFGIETKIPKGENAGKTLKHDFVVIGYRKTKLDPAGESWRASLTKPLTIEVPVEKQALVIWVSSMSDPTPLQALGGWL